MKRRTQAARQALDQYCLSKGEPLDTMESGIIDLMADLLHLAEQKRLDAYTVARTALKHHLVEMEIWRGPGHHRIIPDIRPQDR